MRIVLSIGAVIGCLLGCWAIYVGVVNFGDLPYPSWNYFVLFFELVYIGLSFTPGFMLWKGFKTKRWQLILIGLAELIVIAIPLLTLKVFID